MDNNILNAVLLLMSVANVYYDLICFKTHCNDIHMIYLQGIKIHYVEKGDRSKPLMLFVHGFPEFWYSWRYQVKEFSKDYW